MPASEGSGHRGFSGGEGVLCQEVTRLNGRVLAQGMGVLMVGRTEAAASAATLAIQKALPASCRSCFLAFKVCPHPIIMRPSQPCSAAYRYIGCPLSLVCIS